MGHVCLLALVECRKDIREECLSLPEIVHVFTNITAEMDGVCQAENKEGWGGGWEAKGKVYVCLDAFFFPFPRDQVMESSAC